MKLKYIICAESSSLDVTTGRVSMFHLLEDIGVASVPFFIQSVSISVLLEREQNELNSITIQLVVKSNNQELVTLPMQIEFLDKLRNRNLGTIQGIVVPNFGTMQFVVTYQGQELGRWEFTVHNIGQPSVSNQPSASDQNSADHPAPISFDEAAEPHASP